MGELHIDRTYVNSPIWIDVVAAGGAVFATPWEVSARTDLASSGLFSKGDFKMDLRSKIITWPAGEVEPFTPGETVEFDPEACGDCRL